MKRRHFARTALIAAALAVLPFHAATHAQTNPARIVVPYPPGGGVDAATRAVSEAVSTALATPVIVENKPGAGGNIAMTDVARSKPDGTNFIMAAAGPGAINVSLYPNLGYHPLKDFDPVALVASTVFVVAVPPSLGVKTFEEFIALARSKPGELTFGSVGIGATSHLAVELLKMQANIDLLHIPYKGTGPAMTDLVGGHISMMYVDAIAGKAHFEAGKLIGLAVTSKNRLPSLPHLPTVAEAGVPGYVAVGWSGLLAPKGTPTDVIKKVNESVVAEMKKPQVAATLGSDGSEFGKNTPEDFRAFLEADINRWKQAIDASGTTL